MYTIPLATLSGKSQELVKRSFSDEDQVANKMQQLNDFSESTPLKVKFDFNSDFPAEVVVELFNLDTRKKETLSVLPTDKEIDISTLEDGPYIISFKANDYAYQWHRGNIRKGKFSPRSINIDFRKKRYVVMRYAINLDSEPDFKDQNMYSGVAAFSDLSYGNPQHFLGWRIRQADLGEKRFEDDFILQWKWRVPDSGLCVRTDDFDSIKSARNDEFRLKEIRMEKGLVFTCKSSYSRNPDLYGKFEIIDIVDEPAEDLEVY